jgi:aspartate kinase
MCMRQEQAVPQPKRVDHREVLTHLGIVIQKYGGSSVATAEKMKRVARRIAWKRRQGHDVVVVVSAQGDFTDDLLVKAEDITSRPDPREMDVLLSTGEQISIALMAMALHEVGCPALSLTGPQAGFRTDDNHRAAKVLEIKPDRVRQELAEGKAVVVAGFQGLDWRGDVTTLGRGGSDQTAIALAAALGAEACQIFSDVDGVYTADPRLVPNARRLEEISYDEILELAAAGAQVMQLRSVEFAKLYGVEFEVLSSLSPLPEDGGVERGTRVVANVTPGSGRVVSGVAVDSKIARLTIMSLPDRPGVAARIFGALGKAKVNVDMIVQSAGPGGQATADISFTVARDDLDLALEVCQEVLAAFAGSQLTYDVDVAKVSVVGSAVASNYGVAAQMFEALAERGINIELITGSEIKISCLVRANRAVEAIRSIHDKFQLGTPAPSPGVAVQPSK